MYHVNKIWLISDEHYGHKNVIAYENRPFSSVEDMNSNMILRNNSIVKSDDVVYHLGDFAFHMKLENIKSIIKQLNGNHILVMGNHDRGKIDMWYQAGFMKVYDHPVCIGDFCWLSHRPMLYVTRPYFNIHGHIHANPLVGERFHLGQMFNASVECINYQPVLLANVMKLLGVSISAPSHEPTDITTCLVEESKIGDTRKKEV